MPRHFLKSTVLAACLGAAAAAQAAGPAGPIGYTAWDVSGNDRLLRIDLATGVGTTIGTNIGFSDVDGLAFDAAGQLWGVDDSTNALLRINTSTGAGSVVGSGFGSGYTDEGLAFGGGVLYMSSNVTASSGGNLYTVNTSTGTPTLVGSFGGGLRVRSLGYFGSTLYGWSNVDTLLRINTATGAATSIGPFGFGSPTIGQDGMDADPATGLLWSIAEIENRTYSLDPLTGHATVRAASLSCNGGSCSAGGFNSLAIAVPEPGSWALFGIGLLAIAGAARGRRR